MTYKTSESHNKKHNQLLQIVLFYLFVSIVLLHTKKFKSLYAVVQV